MCITQNPAQTTAMQKLVHSFPPGNPHAKALKLYAELLSGPEPDPAHHSYRAACLFYMGAYPEAEAAALLGPRSQLQVPPGWPYATGGGRAAAHGSPCSAHGQGQIERRAGAQLGMALQLPSPDPRMLAS